MSFVARLAIDIASPDSARYGGNVGEGGQADYGLWPFGAFLPPINPAAIEAAESDILPTNPADGNPPPGSPVPVAVIDAPTATPTPPLVTAEPLESADTTLAEPSPSPTATRTTAPLQVPTQTLPPTSTRAPATVTPAQPSATPVQNPGDLLPTSAPTSTPVRTSTPIPTATSRPANPATPTNTPQTPTASPPLAASPSPTLTPAPTLTPTPPSAGFVDSAIVVGEGTTRALTVRLSTPYHLPVRVGYRVEGGTATAGTDYVLADGTLTFNATTAGTPGVTEQSISIRALADNRNEPNESIIVRLISFENAVSNGTDEAVVTITDGDPPPTVRFERAIQIVPERGSVAATIMLNQVSDIPVVVPYTVGGTASYLSDHDLRAGSVTIPAGATSARLRFTITDDQRDESDEEIRITLGTPSNADLVIPSSFVVMITDDDTAGVQVLTNTTTVAEGQAITYTIRLTSEPTAQVNVSLIPDSQISAAPIALTFTAASWATTQVVTVTAIDDYVDEASPHQGLLMHEIISADPSYNWDRARESALDVAVSIIDDDAAGVELIVGATTAFEGQAITYTLRLTSQPTDTVTITLLPDDQVTVAPTPTLTFTAAKWNVAQTVTVSTIDDFIDEDDDFNLTTHQGVVSHTLASADSNYNDGTRPFPVNPVTVTIVDNDEAGVTVIPVNLSLAEGGASDTYSVMLTSQPADTVTVTLMPNAQVTVVPTPTLAFTPGDWTQAQTVTVTAVDDSLDEDLDANLTPHSGLISHSVTSTDPLYANLQPPYPPDDVAVSITDNDEAGVELIAGTTTVTEGGTVTYTLRLTSQPTAPVTINLAASTTGTITPTLPAAITFSATNWMTPTTVTVGVPDNSIDEVHSTPTFTITNAITSVDPNFDGVGDTYSISAVPVTVLDDDAAGVMVVPVTLSVTEGGPSGSYDVVLRSQPTAPVTITLTADAQVTVVPTPTLVFDDTSWNITRTVTVAAVNDLVDEDPGLNTPVYSGVIRHSVASDDPSYASLPAAGRPADVSVSVTDNDEAGLELLPASLSLSEIAGMNTGSFSLRLQSQPTAPVTVTLTPDAQVTVDPPLPLVFDDTNWDMIRTVTVTTVDDLIVETNPHSGTISLSSTSADMLYSSAWPAYGITITDDDAATVGVSAPSSLVTAESGGVSTFAVWLTSEPTAPVTVTITSSDPSEGTVSAGPTSTLPLIFDSSNWLTQTIVTVTGVDDANYDGQQPYSITIGPAESLDPFYNGRAAAQPTIDLHNNDNEPALASIGDPAPLSEGLSGTSVMTFPVTLMRPPLGTVTVSYTTADLTATAGADYEPATGSITFTPGMTSTVIPVTIYGDALTEPDERFNLQLTGATAADDVTGLSTSVAVGVIVNDDSLLSAGQFMFTGGPLAVASDGYYYTGGANDYGYAILAMPCSWPLDRPLSIELWSPALDAGTGGDAANGEGAGPTEFELYTGDGAGGMLATGRARLYPATAGAPSWETFQVIDAPLPCGYYALRSAAAGDDVNAWSMRVGYDHDGSPATAPNPVVPGTTDRVTLSLLQTTVTHQAAGTAVTAWVYVNPGATELRLRNFDLDAPPGPEEDPDASVRYYAPGDVYDPLGLTGGSAGRVSADGVWSAADCIASPQPGWWRIVVNTGVAGNGYVLEAKDQRGTALPLRYDPPL